MEILRIFRSIETSERNQTSTTMTNSTQNELLSLIEQERKAFIKSEYARLQAIMGDDYQNGTQTCIFHPLPEGTTPDMADPYELSLAELDLLPQLEKCILRMGTRSYMPLFRMMPADITRIHLLASISEKLRIKRTCSTEEIERLHTGHRAYLASKTNDEHPVLIIK